MKCSSASRVYLTSILVAICAADTAHAQVERYDALANSPTIETRSTPGERVVTPKREEDLVFSAKSLIFGAPGRIRTHDPLVRRIGLKQPGICFLTCFRHVRCSMFVHPCPRALNKVAQKSRTGCLL